MTVEGIDVSVYEPTTPSLAGLGFLIARATYGTFHDTRYSQHIGAAARGGLVRGAYGFGVAGVSGRAQAEAFLAAAGAVDLYFLDYEKESGRPIMPPSAAREFIATVKAAKGRCGLYASLSGFPNFGQDYHWVAKWSAFPPSIRWDFWQYHGGPLDRDRWRGSLAELRAFVGHAPVPAPPPGDDMPGVTMYLEVTYDDTPFGALGRARIKGAGHDLKWAATAQTAAANVPDGFDLGIVQRGTIQAPAPAWAAVGEAIVAYNYRGQLAVSPMRDVTFTPLVPPDDASPYTGADLANAHTAGYDEAKTKAIAAVTAI